MKKALRIAKEVAVGILTVVVLVVMMGLSCWACWASLADDWEGCTRKYHECREVQEEDLCEVLYEQCKREVSLERPRQETEAKEEAEGR
jgi:hypothetical protein